MLHAHALAGGRARQRVHPFNGPVSAAHAPAVVVPGSGARWQPALTVKALQSQDHAWVQPSVSRTKLPARHDPTRAAVGTTLGV